MTDLLVEDETVPDLRCLERQDAGGANGFFRAAADERGLHVDDPASCEKYDNDGQVVALTEVRLPQPVAQHHPGGEAQQRRADDNGQQDQAAQQTGDLGRDGTTDQSPRHDDGQQDQNQLAHSQAVSQETPDDERHSEYGRIAPRTPSVCEQPQNRTATNGKRECRRPERLAVVVRSIIVVDPIRFVVRHDDLRPRGITLPRRSVRADLTRG